MLKWTSESEYFERFKKNLPIIYKTYYMSQREIWRDISRAEGE